MKKKLLAFLAATLACVTFAGCDLGDLSALGGLLGGDNSQIEQGGEQGEQGSTEDVESGENGGEQGGSTGESGGGTLDEEELEIALMAGILKSAYALEVGESLEGAQTLKGEVTEIHEVGEYGDLKLTFVVNGYEEYPMYCYWLDIGDETVNVGDIITVVGTIKNYEGTIEYDKPTLLTVETPDDTQGGSGGGSLTTAGEILQAAYALGVGEELGEYTLTGEVVDVAKTNQGDICLTMEVEGYPQYPVYCYWLQDADFLEVGDIITVSGKLINYDNGSAYGLVEYHKPTLLDYEFGSGDDDWEDDESGSGGASGTDADLLTNDGKGLPTGTNGVYSVDFTKAQYVKDVTDQGYYLDGCPTTGSPAVLVIPVQFSDATAASKGYTIDKIQKAFYGATGTTSYYSVKEYYSISSYGKVNLDVTVLDEWFTPAKNSSYYLNATYDYYGEDVAIGDQLIIDEALAYLESRMDLSKFDSDGNKIIDSVVLINTLDVDYDVDMQWAYRYWNIYTDDEGYYYEYDGVSANDYLWASYAFMHEDANGGYTVTSSIETYTYIHEFGHILGADDYYDTAYAGDGPMLGYDMMDSMLGDHNPYTKFNYGWLKTSRLVTAEESVTLTLEDFSKNGDTIIVANNWDETLGAYQEYFVLVYYKNEGLNDGAGGYFDEEGVVVYHVNASLYKEVYEGETYYDVYNNNTSEDGSDGYGTADNLIELVANGGDYVFEAGDSLSSNVKTDSGAKIAYTFTVDSVGEDSVTITFTKNA